MKLVNSLPVTSVRTCMKYLIPTVNNLNLISSNENIKPIKCFQDSLTGFDSWENLNVMFCFYRKY